MSRSIHDTWGVLRRVRREDYADPRQKRDRLLALRANIVQQRALREQVKNRRRQGGLAVPLCDPESIPILVSDEGPYVHHSATAEDVREVLRRLPPGMLDGLNAVHLCLCRRQDHRAEGAIDPYTGSPADELGLRPEKKVRHGSD